ncbi:hypothetical protein VTL71DRAFT_5732 [Oculimacula yallundae]|uniref:Uncharacterized protein n=1 Tax=Oculimacula yallundae TaxID=86028 RepID=A0ABR4BYG5_9HELO
MSWFRTQPAENAASEDNGLKPWDLEDIRNEREGRRKIQFSEAGEANLRHGRRSFGERAGESSDVDEGAVLSPFRNEPEGRRKVRFSEVSGTSARRGRQSFGAMIDGNSDVDEGPVTNPFLDPEDIAPDDCSNIASPNGSEFNTVKIVTPSGTFAEASPLASPLPNPLESPPLPEIVPSKDKRRKTETRFQGPHPFVPGKVNHIYPGETNRKHFTQYVYSSTQPDYAITHHYLCETSDLKKPVYYYHDVGGYTRLDGNHRFTLHFGSHSDCPILGAMWHSASGMHFAVGGPNMNLEDLENEHVVSIQRQHCEFLKPISSVPSKWHMDFTFGGGPGEGPKKLYRWQVVHLSEKGIPQFRHGKLELRENTDGLVDKKGKRKEKGRLFAACRNVDNLATNLWVRNTAEDFHDPVARIRWKSLILLTWGAMRDRMRGPHNTGSPYHNIGYTKSKRVVDIQGDGPAGCMNPSSQGFNRSISVPSIVISVAVPWG